MESSYLMMIVTYIGCYFILVLVDTFYNLLVSCFYIIFYLLLLLYGNSITTKYDSHIGLNKQLNIFVL